MIMWSRTLISKAAAAAFNFKVISLSALLGFKVPDGWLCANTKPTAPYSKACFNTKRTSTRVPVIPPLLNCSLSITLFALFK